MIVTSRLTMGTTKPAAIDPGPKSELVGEVQQVIVPSAPAPAGNTTSAGSNAGSWFADQGRGLGESLFGAIADRAGDEIRYGGPSAPRSAPGSYALSPSSPISPLLIGGLVLGGVAVIALVMKK